MKRISGKLIRELVSGSKKLAVAVFLVGSKGSLQLVNFLLWYSNCLLRTAY